MDQIVPIESAADPGKAPTLETEVEQVKQSLGNLGAGLSSFWGNVRKQSATAYTIAQKELETRTEAARKDLAPYMEKAKEEYSRTKEELVKMGEQLKEQAQQPPQGDDPDALPSFYGEMVTTGPSPSSPARDPSAAPTEGVSLPSGATALFSKLQTQMQPSVAKLSSTLQSVDFGQTGKLAETYVNKSGTYISQAGKELEKLLGDAIKVVPPDEFSAQQYAESSQQVTATSSSKDIGLQAASRKESLIQRLQSNKLILLIDPASDPVVMKDKNATSSRLGADTREPFAAFAASIQQEGGLEGDVWKSKIEEALRPDPDTQTSALQSSFNALVPAKVTAEQFWTRYFFRANQIEEEDARRKKVLESAEKVTDEEFKWDEEEEESTADANIQRSDPSSATASLSTLPPRTANDTPVTPEVVPVQHVAEPTQSTNSTRTSEEGTASSFDMVSATGRSAATSSGINSDVEIVKKVAVAKDGDDDEDSDWE